MYIYIYLYIYRYIFLEETTFLKTLFILPRLFWIRISHHWKKLIQIFPVTLEPHDIDIHLACLNWAMVGRSTSWWRPVGTDCIGPPHQNQNIYTKLSRLWCKIHGRDWNLQASQWVANMLCCSLQCNIHSPIEDISITRDCCNQISACTTVGQEWC